MPPNTINLVIMDNKSYFNSLTGVVRKPDAWIQLYAVIPKEIQAAKDCWNVVNPTFKLTDSFFNWVWILWNNQQNHIVTLEEDILLL